MTVTEEYGVLVGRTLVDVLKWSANVLMVMVPVSAVSVGSSEPGSLGMNRHLLDHLEDIVTGSHPSLGDEGRTTLRNILHQYAHVFLAPGEPVTGRTMSVQHEIVTMDARPVRCGPRRLSPAGLRTEQTCVKEMLDGGQIEPSDRKAAFATHEGLYKFRVMPFGLCCAPATFERLMDRVLCGMRWSRCLVYLDDVISFGVTVSEALL